MIDHCINFLFANFEMYKLKYNSFGTFDHTNLFQASVDRQDPTATLKSLKSDKKSKIWKPKNQLFCD